MFRPLGELRLPQPAKRDEKLGLCIFELARTVIEQIYIHGYRVGGWVGDKAGLHPRLPRCVWVCVCVFWGGPWMDKKPGLYSFEASRCKVCGAPLTLFWSS